MSEGDSGPRAATLLDGAPRSIVLNTSGVSIGSFQSNTIRATFSIWSPPTKSGSGMIENLTYPSPSPFTTFGGRKPANGSSVSSPVSGSSPVNVQRATPLSGSKSASTPTIRCWPSGRRSTSA